MRVKTSAAAIQALVTYLWYQGKGDTPHPGQVSAALPRSNSCLTISHKAMHLAYLVSQLLSLGLLTLRCTNGLLHLHTDAFEEKGCSRS